MITINSSVMLDNFLQQMTSAEDIFRCVFFLGALRVNRAVLHPTKCYNAYNRAVLHPTKYYNAFKGAVLHPTKCYNAFNRAVLHPTKYYNAFNRAVLHPAKYYNAFNRAVLHPAKYYNAFNRALLHPTKYCDTFNRAVLHPTMHLTGPYYTMQILQSILLANQLLFKWICTYQGIYGQSSKTRNWKNNNLKQHFNFYCCIVECFLQNIKVYIAFGPT